MVKFETNGKVIKLPTSIGEIPESYLDGITNDIEVADNYSLVALCHKEKLSAFVLAGRNKKNQVTTSVVPLFVKKGNVTPTVYDYPIFVNGIHTCDKLLIEPSQLALGLHVNVPMNDLTVEKFMQLIEGDGYAYQNAAKITESVLFLEFKLIANCNILGVYKDKPQAIFYNPFRIEDANCGEV